MRATTFESSRCTCASSRRIALLWIRDVFGNSIALVDWLEPADALTIVNDVTVERLAPFPARDLHEPWQVPFPPSIRSARAAITHVYQSPIVRRRARRRCRHGCAQALSRDPLDAEGDDAGARAGRVFRTVTYQRAIEKGVQSPARTLELGTGSCRDMATLMMEAARLLGVAARFASGYLHCTASMAGHASTHAWAEVYLPTLGWRGFDPTLGAATDRATW